MQGEKGALLCHHAGTASSTLQLEKSDRATLSLLSRGFGNGKGRSGGHRQGTILFFFLKTRLKDFDNRVF